MNPATIADADGIYRYTSHPPLDDISVQAGLFLIPLVAVFAPRMIAMTPSVQTTARTG